MTGRAHQQHSARANPTHTRALQARTTSRWHRRPTHIQQQQQSSSSCSRRTALSKRRELPNQNRSHRHTVQACDNRGSSSRGLRWCGLYAAPMVRRCLFAAQMTTPQADRANSWASCDGAHAHTRMHTHAHTRRHTAMHTPAFTHTRSLSPLLFGAHAARHGECALGKTARPRAGAHGGTQESHCTYRAHANTHSHVHHTHGVKGADDTPSHARQKRGSHWPRGHRSADGTRQRTRASVCAAPAQQPPRL
jgi:hypothetical protein